VCLWHRLGVRHECLGGRGTTGRGDDGHGAGDAGVAKQEGAGGSHLTSGSHGLRAGNRMPHWRLQPKFDPKISRDTTKSEFRGLFSELGLEML
jgi:hypothetical protein